MIARKGLDHGPASVARVGSAAPSLFLDLPLIASSSLCAPRTSALTRRRIVRSITEVPPFHAFLAERALPLAVRGPLERSHGFQDRISAAWRALRCGVQPLLIVDSQKFVLLIP